MWSVLVLILALSRTGTSVTQVLNLLDTEPLRFAIDRQRINRNNEEFKGEYGSSIAPGSKDLNDFIAEVTKFKHKDDGTFKKDDDPAPVEKESQEFRRIAIIEEEPTEENYDDYNDYSNLKNYDNEDEENHRLDKISDFLKKILKQSAVGPWKAPLILIEEPADDQDYLLLPWTDNNTEELSKIDDYKNNDNLQTIYPAPWKRSRYYRRYPWKRQNSRSRYDNDISRYLCTPTQKDVFQLLIALHDARQGNKSRTVNFCNRRRPAGSVFTNIRFLGRKK